MADKQTPERQKITRVEIEAAYREGVLVLHGKEEASAVADLHQSFNMNHASATDHIRILRQMLAGQTYHRTLSQLATRIFFDGILADYGKEGLSRALSATLSHADYYETLKTGGNRPALRALCAEYQAILTAPARGKGADGDFQAAIIRSTLDTPKDRQARLARADSTPQKTTTIIVSYRRNPDVVAERLELADGVCDSCHAPAPFLTAAGRPYLEVHHKIPLAEDGPDTVENTAALCPNCHREAHYCATKDQLIAP